MIWLKLILILLRPEYVGVNIPCTMLIKHSSWQQWSPPVGQSAYYSKYIIQKWSRNRTKTSRSSPQLQVLQVPPIKHHWINPNIITGHPTWSNAHVLKEKSCFVDMKMTYRTVQKVLSLEDPHFFIFCLPGIRLSCNSLNVVVCNSFPVGFSLLTLSYEPLKHK